MPFEDRIAQTLRETGEQFAPRDLTGLVNGGVAAGRARRRRRNAAVVGGSAALALVAVGGALVPSLFSTAGSRGVVGPAAQPGMSLTSSAKPVSDSEKAKELLQALESVLPPGARLSGQSARWIPGVKGMNSMAIAELVMDDHKGAAAVSVDMTRMGPGKVALPSCAPDPALLPNDVCHTYKLPGGGQLVIDQGYEYPSKGTGTKCWIAWLDLPNGDELSLTEYNAAAEKDSPVTRANPPLSAEQLRAALLSDVWKPLLRQLPLPVPFHPGPPTTDKPGAGTTPSTGTAH